ncbi:MAG: hypothetical protein AB7I27_03430 [Bacteriovoracaceae bacterium]
MEKFNFLIAVGILKKKPLERHSLLEAMDQNFSGYFSKLRQPEKIGLGFKLKDETEFSFAKYVQNAEVTEVSAHYGNLESHTGLPEHILASFEGTSNLVLRINTRDEIRYFYHETYLSPEYLITQKDLSELLELTAAKDTALKFIMEYYNENFEFNNIPQVSADEIIPLLKMGNFPQIFGDPIFNILHLIQQAIKYDGLLFPLTNKWADLIQVQKSDLNSFRDVGSFTPDATIDHVVKFIDAQENSDKLWELVLNDLNQLFEIKYTRESLREIELYTIPVGNILIVVDNFLQSNLKNVVIPVEVEPFLQWGSGPKDLEARRKWIPEEELWRPKRNDEIYKINWFHEFKEPIKLRPSPPNEVSNFKSALNNIEKFAIENNSYFAEAFTLTKW